MLTVRDLADEYGVSVSRVLQLIAARKRKGLPDVGVQIGKMGMWVFPPSAVDALRPLANGRPCRVKGELS